MTQSPQPRDRDHTTELRGLFHPLLCLQHQCRTQKRSLLLQGRASGWGLTISCLGRCISAGHENGARCSRAEPPKLHFSLVSCGHLHTGRKCCRRLQSLASAQELAPQSLLVPGTERSPCSLLLSQISGDHDWVRNIYQPLLSPAALCAGPSYARLWFSEYHLKP